MAADDDTDEEDSGGTGTMLLLAALGGGALLLWLSLHRGGMGWGGKGNGWGSEARGGNGRGDPSDGSGGGPYRWLHVHVLPNGIELNGITSDLETTLAQARSADYVRFTARGDAVAGWVSKVYYALADAGIALAVDDPHRPPPRFDSNGRPI